MDDLDQTAKPDAGSKKSGAPAVVAAAANLAAEAEQAVVHAVITATKGVEHAVGAVVKLAWQEFHDLAEAGKARPASQAEVDRAFAPPAPAPIAEPEAGEKA